MIEICFLNKWSPKTKIRPVTPLVPSRTLYRLSLGEGGITKAPVFCFGAFNSGADDGNRTRDPACTLAVLYRLSLGEGGKKNTTYMMFLLGADDGNRTRDLRLTKAVLYRLSHISISHDYSCYNIMTFNLLNANSKPYQDFD